MMNRPPFTRLKCTGVSGSPSTIPRFKDAFQSIWSAWPENAIHIAVKDYLYCMLYAQWTNTTVSEMIIYHDTAHKCAEDPTILAYF